MKFAGYKRAATEKEAKTASATLRSAVTEGGGEYSFFAWDLTMGRRGLLRVLRAAESNRVQGIIVEDLKDLSRDLVSLLKIIDSLLSNGVAIIAINEGLRLHNSLLTATAEARTIKALIFAHVAYSNDNRKIGIAAAKAAGAQVGRPTGLTLDDAEPTIERMIEENDDRESPSVRKLAVRLECSEGKAAALLREWKSKPRDQDSKPQC